MAADKISAGFSNSVKSYVSHNIESITTAAAIDASVEAATNQYNQEVTNKVVATVADFLGNAFSGILSVLDQVIDGTAVFIVGDVIIPAYEAIGSLDLGEISLDLDILSGDDGIASNAGRNTLDLKVDTSHFKEQAEELKKWQREFTEGNRFQGFDEILGNSEFISEYSTCSDQTKELAKGFGTMAAYMGIGSIPYVGPVLSGFGAAGSAVQAAYDTGATYEEAQTVGTVAGIAGLITDGALNKVGVAAKGAKSFSKAMGLTALGTITAEIEPLANALTQYLTYGRDEYGFGWDGFNDFLTENGYYAQFAMAGAAGFVRTFVSAAQSEGFKGGIKKVKEKIKSIINDESGSLPLYVEKVNNKYIDDVVDDKVKYSINKIKNEIYKDSAMQEGIDWDNLTDLERQNYIDNYKFSKADLDVINKASAEAQNAAKKVAQATIDRVNELYEQGAFKKGYQPADIISIIQDDVNPEEYLADWYVKEYWEQFEFMEFHGKEYAEVYAFQSGNNSPIVQYGGSVGRKEGMFVMPKKDYLKIINDPTIFDSNGNCINIPKLGEKLGGVDLGDSVISIKQIISKDKIQMPNGSLDGAFLGDWQPGGKTSAGIYEAVADYTNVFSEENIIDCLLTDDQMSFGNFNVSIISHSENVNMFDIYDKLLKKSKNS